MFTSFRMKFVSSAVLCGVGFAAGALLVPQRGGAAETAPRLCESAVVSWDDAKGPVMSWGEMRIPFNGETFATKDMFAGIAVIKPGKAIHGPHRHTEEEFMVITEGSGTWHLDGKEFPAKKGDMLYAAPWVYHGLTNTSAKPLTFVVIKYNGKGVTLPAHPTDSRPDTLPLAKK